VISARACGQEGASVLAQSGEWRSGWYAGTVVSKSPTSETYRVVFVDGTTAEAIDKSSLRVWSRPAEFAWHKRRKPDKQFRRGENGASSQRSVEQLDAKTRELIARWPSSKRASEKLTWILGPEDIVACCRGMTPQAGGYAWRFAEGGKHKIDAADVDELLGTNARITFQQDNPKRHGTKSHNLYETYKKAKTLKEMLSLGGRRADISYDLAHGWIQFDDPELARRFAVAKAAEAKQPDGKKPDDDPESPPA